MTPRRQRNRLLQLAAHVHRLHRFLGLEERRIGLDGDRLVECADSQHDIDADVQAGAHVNVLPHELREALNLGGDRVDAWQHVEQAVVALIVGHRRDRRGSRWARGHDGDAGQRAALLVAHVTTDRPVGLRPQR